ncbi:MAG: hypothetical protein KKA12_05285, partial [Alphaproteobacteria bacterium]|nr:hypothetical protein [Alphaproteobacteria bacterium]
EIGVDQVLCYLNFGYLPHEAVMKSIELLGTRVIPELKKRGKGRVAEGLAEQLRKAEEQQSVTARLWSRTPEASLEQIKE